MWNSGMFTITYGIYIYTGNITYDSQTVDPSYKTGNIINWIKINRIMFTFFCVEKCEDLFLVKELFDSKKKIFGNVPLEKSTGKVTVIGNDKEKMELENEPSRRKENTCERK